VERSIQTGALLTLAIIAVAAALYWLRPVMLPFILALFIAMGLSRLVSWLMRRLRLPHLLAVACTLLLAGVGLSGVAAITWASVAQLSRNAQAYQAQSRALFDRAVALIPAESLSQLAAGLSENAAGSLGQILLGTTNTVLALLSQSVLVMIFVLFLLLGGQQNGKRADGSVLAEVEDRVQRYLITKAAISGATGLLVGLVLGILGVDLALAFGLFAFLLNFVPSVGSIIATLLPLPIVLLSPDVSPTTAVLAMALPGTVQITLGNVVEPKIMGESLDLHPVAILLALIFWGMLWGIAGALLACPLTAIMKILFARLEPTQDLAELMAGRLPSGWQRSPPGDTP